MKNLMVYFYVVLSFVLFLINPGLSVAQIGDRIDWNIDVYPSYVRFDVEFRAGQPDPGGRKFFHFNIRRVGWDNNVVADGYEDHNYCQSGHDDDEFFALHNNTWIDGRISEGNLSGTVHLVYDFPVAPTTNTNSLNINDQIGDNDFYHDPTYDGLDGYGGLPPGSYEAVIVKYLGPEGGYYCLSELEDMRNLRSVPFEVIDNEWPGEITDVDIHYDLTLPSGSSLTILEATINLEYTHKIIVEDGASLIINNAEIIAQNATFIDDSYPPEPTIPGNVVILEGSGQLTASNSLFTTIEENQRWDGIRVTDGGTAFLNDCILENAITAIYADNGSYLQIHHNELNNCWTGVAIDQADADIWANVIQGGESGIIFSDGFFMIQDNDIYVENTGIHISHAHRAVRIENDITDNDIVGAHIGVAIWDSQVRLGYNRNQYDGNRLTDNNVGVLFSNESAASFFSNTIQDTRTDPAVTGGPEIFFSGDSDFIIANGENTVSDALLRMNTLDANLVHCISWDGVTQYDIDGNTWDPDDSWIFEPPGAFGFTGATPSKELFALAEEAEINNDDAGSKSLYEEIIDTYPESDEAGLSVKRLYGLEKSVTHNFSQLRSYFESTVSGAYSDLEGSLQHFIIMCYISEENYSAAIDLLQAIIDDSNTEPEQAVFAEIDLAYVNHLMGGGAQPMSAGSVPHSENRLRSFQSYRQKADELMQTLTFSQAHPPNTPAEIPERYEVSQSYPNPFNSSATIAYRLPQAGQVSLKVYNTMGQLVRTLVDHEESSGFKSAQWDGRNDHGKQVAGGIYFYRLKTESGFDQSKRMVLLK
ncbi:MAG: hypothetical protein B6244_14610 [Candidatus Cloacimonetes bacterium 4572_55]|nr:MAG: hypothetical protein B6244_14610 [Candidatus Cloacimonetes bacterium 4572_55]